MAPATTSTSSATSPTSEDFDDIFNTNNNTFQPSTYPSVSSDDFLYDNSNNSTPPIYSLLNVNGTAGVASNYTSIRSDSDISLGAIAVGGLDDIAMIRSVEVIDDDNNFYRPSHLMHSPKQHVAETFPSNSTVKDGGVSDSANSNFMFLLEDMGEFFYNYNSTSIGDSGNSGYYFSGITSTGFPNTTEFFHNCTNNVTCIDSIAGLYCYFGFLHPVF